MDSLSRLSRITLLLHWLVAIPFIGMIALGLYMAEFEVFEYYTWHKSIGILLAFIILARVIWRIKQGWPLPIARYTALEIFLAKKIHWLLISATVLMPFSGMLLSGASGHGFGVFGLELVAANPDPTDPKKVIPYNAFWAEVGENVHEYIGYLLIAAIALHVLAALKHHVVDKDATLLRMLGKNTPR